MERHRIGIVIPALNEVSTIAAVVANAATYGVPVVVDDGSSDGTGAAAREAGAEVVRHDVNRGYDGALNSGFARAAELGCLYVVTMDADGQHDPTTIKAFLDSLDAGADVVLGIRDKRQRFAEVLFGWVAYTRWGVRDPLCGMKAYRMDVWRELGHFDSYGSIGTELALFAAVQRKRLSQRAVQTRPRLGTPRFGTRFTANTRILRSLWIGTVRQPARWRATAGVTVSSRRPRKDHEET